MVHERIPRSCHYWLSLRRDEPLVSMQVLFLASFSSIPNEGKIIHPYQLRSVEHPTSITRHIVLPTMLSKPLCRQRNALLQMTQHVSRDPLLVQSGSPIKDESITEINSNASPQDCLAQWRWRLLYQNPANLRLAHRRNHLQIRPSARLGEPHQRLQMSLPLSTNFHQWSP